MTPDPRAIPLTRHARASWLCEKAEDCVRQADEAKAVGKEGEAMAFLALAQEYRRTANLRAVEEAADG
jgi:hypothetical protein